jgi:lipopolysaccharide/colanic/teichoic acid biosynthesis glycosyltransferase
MAAIRDRDDSARCRRLCDILLACLVIGCFLPLMAAVALVLKADSSGPVLRRRVRICRDGRWVQTFEFRMPTSCDPGMAWVHRFLRWTHIDRLPQAIDVLRGDTTFVGRDRPGFLT